MSDKENKRDQVFKKRRHVCESVYIIAVFSSTWQSQILSFSSRPCFSHPQGFCSDAFRLYNTVTVNKTVWVLSQQINWKDHKFYKYRIGSTKTSSLDPLGLRPQSYTNGCSHKSWVELSWICWLWRDTLWINFHGWFQSSCESESSGR